MTQKEVSEYILNSNNFISLEQQDKLKKMVSEPRGNRDLQEIQSPLPKSVFSHAVNDKQGVLIGEKEKTKALNNL